MNGKKLMSIVAIFVVSAIVVSGALANGALAQVSKSQGDSTSTASKDYKNFQKCLSKAEATKGYAIEQEIKDCFSPIYNLGSNSSTSSDTGSTTSGQ